MRDFGLKNYLFNFVLSSMKFRDFLSDFGTNYFIMAKRERFLKPFLIFLISKGIF